VKDIYYRQPPMTTEVRSTMSDDPHQPAARAMPPADESTGPLEQLAATALVAEAEDLTRGVRYLSVATGDPETDDELARINTLTDTAWIPQPDAATTSIRGGNDYLTIRIEGPGADAFVEQLAALAQRLNPGFWRISHSPHPF
jgi:hypothetical protein